MWQFLSCNKDQFELIISAITLVLVFYGLVNWKIQLQGTSKYTIKKKLLEKIYRLEDIFKYVRQTAFWNNEYPVNKKLSQKETTQFIIENRLKLLSTTLEEFENLYYEACAIWEKKKFNSEYLQLRKIYFELIDAFNTYLNYYDDSKKSKKPDYLNAYYTSYETNQNKEFSNQIESAVRNFEKCLTKKSWHIWKRK